MQEAVHEEISCHPMAKNIRVNRYILATASTCSCQILSMAQIAGGSAPRCARDEFSPF
jgi:hypothetical protein